MNSNNQPPIPANYLDQIATKPQRKLDMFRKKPILTGLLLGFFIITVVLLIISGIVASRGHSLEYLAARLVSTEEITTDATSKIKSSKLKALNSSLNSYLTNAIRDVTPILKDENINIDKLDKKITAAESNTEILAKLEDARLNAVYDRTYASEMAYQLDTILTLSTEVYNNSNNDDLKTALRTIYSNLNDIQKQLADYSSANS